MANNSTSFARQLRKNQTIVEKIIWNHLKSKQLGGLKFRLQQPIGPFIVDFVCFENMLVIELDGSQHIDNKGKDSARDDWLQSQGFLVLRFLNNQVIDNCEGVLAVIYDYCHTHPPLTPPIEGGG